MMFSRELNLNKNSIILRPLIEIYFEPLKKLAAEKTIWKYTSEPLFDPIVFREKWLDKAMRQIIQKKRQCFVIFYNDEVVGSSSYYDIDEPNKKLNIGYTWIHPSYWGTRVNPTTKLIMIDYALEVLQFHRVAFCIDALNQHSCKALEKLGIKREGVLRKHMILSDGRIRDSIIFSVIDEEWLEIKKNIEKVIAVL